MAPATPLSKASRVRICRGVMPRRSSSMTCRPDCLAMRLRRLDTAGAVPQPGQRHAQYLCEHTHGVGGTQVGAASHGGQGGLLGLLHLFHGTAPLLHPAGEFPQLTGAKQRVAAHVAGQHGAAGDHDGRDVQPGGGMRHAGV